LLAEGALEILQNALDHVSTKLADLGRIDNQALLSHTEHQLSRDCAGQPVWSSFDSASECARRRSVASWISGNDVEPTPNFAAAGGRVFVPMLS
jgi:hypothetical protein